MLGLLGLDLRVPNDFQNEGLRMVSSPTQNVKLFERWWWCSSTFEKNQNSLAFLEFRPSEFFMFFSGF